MRYARSARRYIVLTAVTGLATAVLVVAQAFLISRVISPVITGESTVSQVLPLVGVLAVVVILRAFVLLIQEVRAHRAATGTIIELRRLVIERAAALGPRWQAAHGAETTTLLTRGMDDLEPYFTRYLPQLLMAATVTPLTGLVMLLQDVPSTIAVVLTIPLIPIFMILIGKMTQQHSADRLEAMERLGAQVLDLIAGLPTLKALGREIGPGRRVRELGRAYNRTTMATLRAAFLSGAVLEFLTTLSVAIIAVEVGFRLLFGHMDLATGLLVIMIAPEVYQPLRQVGFQFHASANGVAAAQAVFEVLEAPALSSGTLPAPRLEDASIELEHLSVAARGAWAPHDLSATIRPGRLTALSGPSGAGKTTTSQVFLRLLEPEQGRVRVISADGAAQDLAETEPTSWWRQISWVPQRPVLLPGTIRSNLMPTDDVSSPDHGAHAPVPARVLEAARVTGLNEVIDSLPQGWDTPVGHAGTGLSVGQRQRLALTRALVSTAPLVVMDEPTAHLDAASEAHVLDGLAALRASGRTVVVIAHRSSVLALADDVITVSSAPAPQAGLTAKDDGSPGSAPAATALTDAEEAAR